MISSADTNLRTHTLDMPDPQHGNSSTHDSSDFSLRVSFAEHQSDSLHKSISDESSGSSNTSQDSDNSPSSEENNDTCNASPSPSTSSNTNSDKTSTSSVLSIVNSLLRKITIGGQKPKKKNKQKSILKRPVCHIHQRGISGLHTKRVAVHHSYFKKPHSYHRFKIYEISEQNTLQY